MPGQEDGAGNEDDSFCGNDAKGREGQRPPQRRGEHDSDEKRGKGRLCGG